jgi:four helix bundle protein
LYDLETQLQLAADLKYVNADRTEALNLECDEVARMINGLLSAIERSSSAAAG